MKTARILSGLLASIVIAVPGTADDGSGTIEISISGGWTLNGSSGSGAEQDLDVVQGPTPCQSDEFNVANVQPNFQALGTGGPNITRSNASAHGNTRPNCILTGPADASEAGTSMGVYVHSPGNGTIDFHIQSSAAANASNSVSGLSASATFKIKIVGGSTFPFQIHQRTNSASVIDTSETESQFATLDSCWSKDYFSIRADGEGCATADLAPSSNGLASVSASVANTCIDLF